MLTCCCAWRTPINLLRVISEIQIKNFKSIADVTLRLGRVTVLIGENGSGKSNVLEAIAFASCVTTNKLDDEILFHRGVRVTDHTWMLSAFPDVDAAKKRKIEFKIKGKEGEEFDLSVTPKMRKEDNSFLKWNVSSSRQKEILEQFVMEDLSPKIQKLTKQIRLELKQDDQSNEAVNKIFQAEISKRIEPLFQELHKHMQGEALYPGLSAKLGLADFLIYAPENSTLRLQPTEGATQPLGTKGEGLFRLLQSFGDEKFRDRLTDLQLRLHLFGWFDKFDCSEDSANKQATLKIHDRWLADDKSTFDQRSANEGFLFVLFYFALLISWRTPKFFALDNIDTALNPKLCITLMQQIVELAKKHNKQVICTTHNPAILDGLDLSDDEQRLYTVQRDSDGHTVLRRVRAPEPQKGEAPVRLSVAFLRGLIGGLPDHF
jgi:AAA15 family ATPase/GTPase